MSWKVIIIPITVLILLITSLGESQDDWSVTVEINQKNKAVKPFDVFGDLNYNVLINNSGLSDFSYIIELTVGPDTRNKAIKKNFQTSFPHLKVKSGSSNTAVFTVNFAEFEGSDDFLQWMADENRTEEWREAWYKLSVKPFPFGEQKEKAELREYPTLIKPFFEYIKGSNKVIPAQGNATTPYTYEVTVIGSYPDNITLEVSSDLVGGSKSLGSRNYDTKNVRKTLIWENQTLGFDFNSASYRFIAVRSSETFDGPFWPVDVEWRNNSLHPERGLSNTPFSYGLEVNASKPIEVGLYVKDVSSGLYNLAERKSYSNISHWQLLNWTGITPSNTADAEGPSRYYFGFFYPGKDTPFMTTKDRPYPGPEIVQVIFKNQSVSPDNGSVLIPYSYSVDIETTLPRALVQLKTSNSGSDEWDPRREVLYNGTKNSLTWKDVMLSGNLDGTARYKFVSGKSESDVYYGPNITKPFKAVGTVNPNCGVLQGFAIDDVFYSFVYTASITNLSEGIKPWIELLVKSPNSGWRTVGERKQYDSRQSSICWNVKPFVNESFLGEAEFMFRINGIDTDPFKGPKIVAIYDEPSWKDTGNQKYSYWAWFNATKDLNIDLIYSEDGQHWTAANKPQTYKANSGRKQIIWPDQSGHNEFEFDIKIVGDCGLT